MREDSASCIVRTQLGTSGQRLDDRDNGVKRTYLLQWRFETNIVVTTSLLEEGIS